MSRRPGVMLGEVLRHSVRRPATEQYPFVKADLPPGTRARLQFHAERCIGCKLCMKDCPARAIEITKVGNKRFECHIWLGRCIFCAQCVDSCPKDALEATADFELAALTPEGLEITFHAPDAPPPPPGDAETPA